MPAAIEQRQRGSRIAPLADTTGVLIAVTVTVTVAAAAAGCMATVAALSRIHSQLAAINSIIVGSFQSYRQLSARLDASATATETACGALRTGHGLQRLDDRCRETMARAAGAVDSLDQYQRERRRDPKLLCPTESTRDANAVVDTRAEAGA
jgi:hypothetical protein